MRLPSERKRFDAFELERKKMQIEKQFAKRRKFGYTSSSVTIKSELLFKNLKRTDKCGRYE